jgi:hypothetical protein
MQTATDARHGLVAASDVIGPGDDAGQLRAMLGRGEGQQNCLPREVLLDAGYAGAADVGWAQTRGCKC